MEKLNVCSSEFLVRRDGDPLGIKRQMLTSYSYTIYIYIHAEYSFDKGNIEKIASKKRRPKTEG